MDWSWTCHVRHLQAEYGHECVPASPDQRSMSPHTSGWSGHSGQSSEQREEDQRGACKGWMNKCLEHYGKTAIHSLPLPETVGSLNDMVAHTAEDVVQWVKRLRDREKMERVDLTQKGWQSCWGLTLSSFSTNGWLKSIISFFLASADSVTLQGIVQESWSTTTCTM